MNYKCELTQQLAQPVLSIRTRAAVEKLPQVLGSAYGSIMQYLSETGEHPGGAPFVAYFNMDMSDLDMEVGFPVAKALPGRGEIKPSEIPSGLYASCLHTGSYRQIEAAYTALMQWINENGYNPAGAAYEIYLNDPATTPESELQTKISFLLLGK